MSVKQVKKQQECDNKWSTTKNSLWSTWSASLGKRSARFRLKQSSDLSHNNDNDADSVNYVNNEFSEQQQFNVSTPNYERSFIASTICDADIKPVTIPAHERPLVTMRHAPLFSRQSRDNQQSTTANSNSDVNKCNEKVDVVDAGRRRQSRRCQQQQQQQLAAGEQQTGERPKKTRRSLSASLSSMSASLSSSLSSLSIMSSTPSGHNKWKLGRGRRAAACLWSQSNSNSLSSTNSSDDSSFESHHQQQHSTLTINKMNKQNKCQKCDDKIKNPTRARIPKRLNAAWQAKCSLLSKSTSHLSTSSTHIVNNHQIVKKSHKLFGESLAKLCHSPLAVREPKALRLPAPIWRLLHELFMRAPECVGIFRKSPNAKQCKELRLQLESNARDECTFIAKYHVTVVASVFKEFLRCLPDCVLMRRHYKEWIEASKFLPDCGAVTMSTELDTNNNSDKHALLALSTIVQANNSNKSGNKSQNVTKHQQSMGDHAANGKQTVTNAQITNNSGKCSSPTSATEARKRIVRLLASLDTTNEVLLRHTICVLWHIAHRAHVNKMSADNLGVCVGQSLLNDGNKASACSQSSPKAQEMSKFVPRLVAYLIANALDLFGPQVIGLFGPPPVSVSSEGQFSEREVAPPLPSSSLDVAAGTTDDDDSDQLIDTSDNLPLQRQRSMSSSDLATVGRKLEMNELSQHDCCEAIDEPDAIAPAMTMPELATQQNSTESQTIEQQTGADKETCNGSVETTPTPPQTPNDDDELDVDYDNDQCRVRRRTDDLFVSSKQSTSSASTSVSVSISTCPSAHRMSPLASPSPCNLRTSGRESSSDSGVSPTDGLVESSASVSPASPSSSSPSLTNDSASRVGASMAMARSRCSTSGDSGCTSSQSSLASHCRDTPPMHDGPSSSSPTGRASCELLPVSSGGEQTNKAKDVQISTTVPPTTTVPTTGPTKAQPEARRRRFLGAKDKEQHLASTSSASSSAASSRCGSLSPNFVVSRSSSSSGATASKSQPKINGQPSSVAVVQPTSNGRRLYVASHAILSRVRRARSHSHGALCMSAANSKQERHLVSRIRDDTVYRHTTPSSPEIYDDDDDDDDDDYEIYDHQYRRHPQAAPRLSKLAPNSNSGPQNLTHNLSHQLPSDVGHRQAANESQRQMQCKLSLNHLSGSVSLSNLSRDSALTGSSQSSTRSTSSTSSRCDNDSIDLTANLTAANSQQSSGNTTMSMSLSMSQLSAPHQASHPLQQQTISNNRNLIRHHEVEVNAANCGDTLRNSSLRVLPLTHCPPPPLTVNHPQAAMANQQHYSNHVRYAPVVPTVSHTWHTLARVPKLPVEWTTSLYGGQAVIYNPIRAQPSDNNNNHEHQQLNRGLSMGNLVDLYRRWPSADIATNEQQQQQQQQQQPIVYPPNATSTTRIGTTRANQPSHVQQVKDFYLSLQRPQHQQKEHQIGHKPINQLRAYYRQQRQQQQQQQQQNLHSQQPNYQENMNNCCSNLDANNGSCNWQTSSSSSRQQQQQQQLLPPGTLYAGSLYPESSVCFVATPTQTASSSHRH